MNLEEKIAEALISTEKDVVIFNDWYEANTNNMTKEFIALSDLLLDLLKDNRDLDIYSEISPNIYLGLSDKIEVVKPYMSPAKYRSLVKSLSSSKITIDQFIKELVFIIVYSNTKDKSTDIQNALEKSYKTGYEIIGNDYKDRDYPKSYTTGLDDRTLDKTIDDNIGFIITMSYLELKRLLVLKEKNYKVLKKKVKIYQNRIKNNMISANNTTFNKGVLESMKDSGIERYRFSAILDSRTSDICREMNGKVFLVSEAIIGINYPALHHGCRSIAVPLVS